MQNYVELFQVKCLAQINKRNIWHEMSGGMLPPVTAGIDAAANR